jgi:hypothetical protein
MPTVVELAGANYPGGEILPMEGASLAASFTKDENPNRTLIVWGQVLHCDIFLYRLPKVRAQK